MCSSGSSYDDTFIEPQAEAAVESVLERYTTENADFAVMACKGTVRSIRIEVARVD